MRRINSHPALWDTQQYTPSYQCVVFPYKPSPLWQKRVAGYSGLLGKRCKTNFSLGSCLPLFLPWSLFSYVPRQGGRSGADIRTKKEFRPEIPKSMVNVKAFSFPSQSEDAPALSRMLTGHFPNIMTFFIVEVG